MGELSLEVLELLISRAERFRLGAPPRLGEVISHAEQYRDVEEGYERWFSLDHGKELIWTTPPILGEHHRPKKCEPWHPERSVK